MQILNYPISASGDLIQLRYQFGISISLLRIDPPPYKLKYLFQFLIVPNKDTAVRILELRFIER